MRSILSGSVLLLFWSLTINLFLQEAEHETAFSCRKSSVMVYYEHLVRFLTNLVRVIPEYLMRSFTNLVRTVYINPLGFPSLTREGIMTPMRTASVTA